MKINYNINHRLLELPVFTNVRGHNRRALLITLSMIVHFTKHIGSCHFYQGQLAEDWDITDRYFRWAIKRLLDAKIITLVKPYDRKTLSPAVYATSTGYIRQVSNLYTPGTKPIDATSRVNNNKLFKPQNDDFNQSSSVNGKSTQLTEEELIKLKQKQRDL